MDAGLEGGLPRLDDERPAARHARVVAAPGKRVDDVVHRAEHARRVGQSAPGLPQALERDRPRALVQEDAVYGYERHIVVEVADDVGVPDLVEERERRVHGPHSSAWQARRALHLTEINARNGLAVNTYAVTRPGCVFLARESGVRVFEGGR